MSGDSSASLPSDRVAPVPEQQAPGDEPLFLVVRNEEEQYSIWPAERAIPAGWDQSGPASDRASCLEYIKENWPDIRPLSVRRRLNEAT